MTKKVAGSTQLNQAEEPGPPAEESTPATQTPVIKKIEGKLALDHSVTVEIDNLSEYIESKDRDPSKFVLYLEGRPLKGLKSTRNPTGKNFLQFDIDSTPDSKEAWDALLSRPFSRDRGFSYPVRVSVGYGEENPFPNHIKHDLEVINKTRFWAFFAFFVFVVFLFLKYARNSAMLRDPLSAESDEESTELGGKKLGEYSLGRTQMAWWFFIVLFSVLLI